jgi:multidrug transporter EmrE-like cation transporter
MTMYRASLELAAAVLFNVGSYLLYRSIADAEPRIWWPRFALGLTFGACNTFLFARALKALPLSVAYPAFTGASFAFITLAAAVAFQERLPPVHLLGIGLVMAGIFLVTR